VPFAGGDFQDMTVTPLQLNPQGIAGTKAPGTRGRPSIARGDTANSILDRLAELSRTFGTKSEHEDKTAIYSCRVRLLLLDFCEQQRFLAGLGQFREMVFHAGLDTPAAGLNVSAFFMGVGLASLGYRHVTDQRGLARCGELAEVILDARLEPAVAGLNLGAHLLDVRSAGLRGRTLLGHRPSRRQQQYTHQAESRDFTQPAVVGLPRRHDSGSPALRSPGK
jgi:hypothetical protein